MRTQETDRGRTARGFVPFSVCDTNVKYISSTKHTYMGRFML